MAAAQKRSFASVRGASLVFWCECLPVARRRTRRSPVGSPALPFPFGTTSRRTVVFISQTPRTHLQEASRRTGSSAWQAVAASGGDFKGAPPPPAAAKAFRVGHKGGAGRGPDRSHSACRRFIRTELTGRAAQRWGRRGTGPLVWTAVALASGMTWAVLPVPS